jgi:site-specific DNA-methyltransferase (adenine-specific)
LWIVPDVDAAARFALHDGFILRPHDAAEAFAADHDTWYYPRVNGTFKERKGWHGCQMPEQILGRIIRACSHAGDVVLDPFTGSGTTLAVARKLERQFVGFELSEQYAERARERTARVRAGDPLDGVENPLTSVPATADGVRLGERENRKQPRKGTRQQTLDLE